MTSERLSTMQLVKIMEILFIRIPYTSHRTVPIEAIINICNETSFTDRERQVFITWGRKVVQDRIPAQIPIISGFMEWI